MIADHEQKSPVSCYKVKIRKRIAAADKTYVEGQK